MASTQKCVPKEVHGAADLIEVLRDSLNIDDIFSKDGWDVGCKLLSPLITYVEGEVAKTGIAGKVADLFAPKAIKKILDLITEDSGGIVTNNSTMGSPMDCQVLIWKAIKADVIKSLATRKGSKASDIISYYQISSDVLKYTSVVSLIIANIIAYLCFSVNVALPLPEGSTGLASDIQSIDSTVMGALSDTGIGFPLFAKYKLSQTELQAITNVFQLLIPQQEKVPTNGIVVSLSVKQPGGGTASISLQNHQLNGPLGLRSAQSYITPLVADVVYSNCKDGIFNGLPAPDHIETMKNRYCSPKDNGDCNKSCAITPGTKGSTNGGSQKGGSKSSGKSGGTPLPKNHSKGLASWEIALIVIGSVLVVAGITVTIVYFVSRARHAKHSKPINQK